MDNLDSAERGDELCLPLRESIQHLVRSKTILVQTTGLASGLIDHDIMPQYRQAVSTRKTRRPGTHNTDRFARSLTSRKKPGTLLKRIVHCKALQQSDRDRSIITVIADTDPLAQGLYRTGSCTSPSHDVLFENKARGADCVAIGNHADKSRDVDPGRARLGARRIETEITPLGFDSSGVPFQGSVHLTKIALALGFMQPLGSDTRWPVMRCCDQFHFFILPANLST